MITLTVQIAGITFRIESNVWIPRVQEEPFELFRVRDGVEPDVRYHFHKVSLDLSDLTPRAEAEWLTGVNCHAPEGLDSPLLGLPEIQAQLREVFLHPERAGASIYPDRICIYDFSERRYDFFYVEEYGKYDESRQIYLAEHRLANNLRQIFSTFLPFFSAFLVHSSGVIRQGQAALFLAPDEGGKTTVINHSTEGLFLNDDQVVLRKEGDTVVAHATPLGRITSGPCQAKIGGLFLIEKGESFALEPFPPADLVHGLWDAHVNYTFILPKPLKIRAFDLLCDACYQAPTYKMRCNKDFVDWGAVDAAMRG